MGKLLASAAISLICVAAHATSPVRYTFEDEVCKSEFIFVGRAVEVRVIRTRQYCHTLERPKLSGQDGEEGLRMECEAYELGVAVEEVLRPIDWKPVFSDITYRFAYPGSIARMTEQLSGRRRIFFAVPFVDDQFHKLKASLFEVALGKDPSEKERVRAVVASACKPLRAPGFLLR
jgi:hypothetical protein